MKIEAAKIKSYVDRIGHVLDQIEELKGDVRDLYDEAKGQHVVPKILRKVVVRHRAKDKAALILEDDLLDAYLAALDGPTREAVKLAAQGASAREIEAATGIDHATVARSVSLKKKRETPHDPETGEIEERSDRQSAPCDGEASAACNPASASSSPPDAVEAAMQELTDIAQKYDTYSDHLTIPAHLRRERAA